MPVLVRLYRTGDAERRADVASIFYFLSWKSDEAAEAMLEDMHTDYRRLCLAVQRAIRRVINDGVVVDTLLDTPINDAEPLFRQKAACGLASDQIHLTEERKLWLCERLVEMLESPNAETRSLTIWILHVDTGQDEGYRTWLRRCSGHRAWHGGGNGSASGATAPRSGCRGAKACCGTSPTAIRHTRDGYALARGLTR